MIQNQELMLDFYEWTREVGDTEDFKLVKITNPTELLMNGVYSAKSLFIRNEFKEKIELICEKVTTCLGERPLFYLIDMMKNNLPSRESKIDTLRSQQFFELFGALITQY